MSVQRADAVAVGASAGAVAALSAILPALPHDYPLPLFVVVHVPPDKKSLLPALLKAKCRIDVREAEDKEPILPGTAYVAPPDYHLLVETSGRLSLSSEEPVHYSRPSIDVLFESAAEVYGEMLVGVVLSGSNDDGAEGSRLIQKAGGTVLVQRPDLAQSPGMPQAALDACPEARAMSLEEIAQHLLKVATLI